MFQLLYTEQKSITHHPVSMVINPLMATRYIQVLYMVACILSRSENI